MKILDIKCKCGSDDLFCKENGTQVGIYCSKCGKYIKWAGKDERNLIDLERAKNKAKADEKATDNEDMKKALDRAKTLLKATYDLLQKQQDSSIVLNILSTTVEYDDAECDGNCLQEDIDVWFEENFKERLSEDDSLPF